MSSPFAALLVQYKQLEVAPEVVRHIVKTTLLLKLSASIFGHAVRYNICSVFRWM